MSNDHFTPHTDDDLATVLKRIDKLEVSPEFRVILQLSAIMADFLEDLSQTLEDTITDCIIDDALNNPFNPPFKSSSPDVKPFFDP